VSQVPKNLFYTGLGFVPQAPTDKDSALLLLILTAISKTITALVRFGWGAQALRSTLFSQTTSQTLNAVLTFFEDESKRTSFEFIMSQLFKTEGVAKNTFKDTFASLGFSLKDCLPQTKEKYKNLKVASVLEAKVPAEDIFLILPETPNFTDDANIEDALSAYIVSRLHAPSEEVKAKTNKYIYILPVIAGAVAAYTILSQHTSLFEKKIL